MAPLKPGTPFRLSTGSVVVTALVLVGLAWQSHRSSRTTETVIREHAQLTDLIGTIVYLDEVLTMSARMAVATGEARWERRYQSFEPQLTAALEEAKRLAPKALVKETASQTDAANLRLVEMEQDAFRLAKEGHLEEARAVLYSRDYEEQKLHYAKGMDRLTVSMQARAGAAMRRRKHAARVSTVVVLATLLILLGGWIVVLNMEQRRHSMLLVYENQQLASQTKELGQLTTVLDEQVSARTGELVTVNAALSKEVMTRKEMEEALRVKLEELQRLNKIMMGREERILELKQEVNALLRQLGKEVRYTS